MSINLTLSIYEPISEEDGEVKDESEVVQVEGEEGGKKFKRKIYRLEEPIFNKLSSSSIEMNYNQNQEEGRNQEKRQLEGLIDSLQKLRNNSNQTLTSLILKNSNFENLKERRFLENYSNQSKDQMKLSSKNIKKYLIIVENLKKPNQQEEDQDQDDQDDEEEEEEEEEAI